MDIGSLRHRIVLENPTSSPDGDGGFTQTWTALSPSPVFAAIKSARDLSRIEDDTTISLSTYIVTMRYHKQVTTKTRITFGTRTFNVTGVSNPDERNITSVLTAVEVVP